MKLSNQEVLEKRPCRIGLPGDFYTSSDHYQQEIEKIWYEDWIFAGYQCELAKPGDYLCFSVAERDVVIVNNGEKLNAFENRCPQSGLRLCSGAFGHHPLLGSSELVVRYTLDGVSLSSKGQCLKAVALESIEGLLFVCLAKRPASFKSFAATITSYIQRHHLAKLKISFQSTAVVNANWKLVFENVREYYQCLEVHVESSADYPKESAAMDEAKGAFLQPGEGVNTLVSDCGSYWMARASLLNKNNSNPTDDQTTIGASLTANAGSLGALDLVHYPNMWSCFRGDHTVLFRVLPLSEQSALVTTKWLQHHGATEASEPDLSQLKAMSDASTSNLKQIVEEIQQGVNMHLYRSVLDSMHRDTGLVQFVEWYSKQLLER